MDWRTAALVIGLVVTVVFFVFRRYITALIYDYVVDFGLSTLDNFLGGIGLVGVDIGDFLAAPIIFFKERKITGFFFALFVAWEAANFFPVGLILSWVGAGLGALLGLIPYVGAVLGPLVGTAVGESWEVVCNLLPSVTIFRILFSKYGPAERQLKKLRRMLPVAEKAQLKDLKKYKEAEDHIGELLAKENPVEALGRAKHAVHGLADALTKRLKALMQESTDLIAQATSTPLEAAEDILAMLRDGIAACEEALHRAQDALDDKGFETAFAAAEEARRLIIEAMAAVEDAVNEEAGDEAGRPR